MPPSSNQPSQSKVNRELTLKLESRAFTRSDITAYLPDPSESDWHLLAVAARYSIRKYVYIVILFQKVKRGL